MFLHTANTLTSLSCTYMGLVSFRWSAWIVRCHQTSVLTKPPECCAPQDLEDILSALRKTGANRKLGS